MFSSNLLHATSISLLLIFNGKFLSLMWVAVSLHSLSRVLLRYLWLRQYLSCHTNLKLKLEIF